MAFERITKYRDKSEPLRSLVRAKSYNRGLTEFHITHDVHEQMGHPTHVEVFTGTGKDRGKLMLVPSGNRLNAYRVSFSPRHARVVLSSVKMGWPVLSTRIVGVPFIVDDGTLIVEFDPAKHATHPVSKLAVAGGAS